MRDQNPFSWKFTAPLYMGSTLNPINSSMIATALVPIAAYLHIPVSHTTLLVTALYLASSIAQPTAGKLSEVFGPRRVFLTGIVLVLLGGLLGGISRDLLTLAASRVLIGIGTSTAYPSAMLLIRRRAERARMSKPPGNVLGALQIAGVVTSVVGLPLGGVLVAAWGWRMTFFINIPFALTALLMAARWIPRDESLRGVLNFRTIASRIDLPGILGFAGAMIALLVFLFSLPVPAWFDLVLALVLGGVLIWWELRVKHPFIDVRLLGSNLALTRTYLRFASLTLCIYTALFCIFICMFLMMAVICLVASTLRSASLRTSFATTENPRPCSPARTASIAALSANKLVWEEISSITLIISPIFSESSSSSFILLLTSSMP